MKAYIELLKNMKHPTETFDSIGEWAHGTFGPVELGRGIERAKEEFYELEIAPTTEEAIEEAADVIITLAAMVYSQGGYLQDAIDKKMKINRARRWKTHGDGTGYHIK